MLIRGSGDPVMLNVDPVIAVINSQWHQGAISIHSQKMDIHSRIFPNSIIPTMIYQDIPLFMDIHNKPPILVRYSIVHVV